MRYIRNHMPVLALAVLAALATTAWLGRRPIISLFVAAGQINALADTVFFLLSLLYAGLLWQAKRRLPPRLFHYGLWAAGILSLLVIVL